MAIKFTQISGLVLTVLSVGILTVPNAQAENATPTTIPQTVDNLISTHSGNYLSNRTFGRQITRIFGFGFPEQELESDARNSMVAFKELMYLQNSTDPILRVTDLPSPYNTSLLTLPRRQSSVGTGFIFENR
ncbi:MAG: hypothetical protein ACOYMP_08350 [Nodosilinea sp.]